MQAYGDQFMRPLARMLRRRWNSLYIIDDFLISNQWCFLSYGVKAFQGSSSELRRGWLRRDQTPCWQALQAEAKY